MSTFSIKLPISLAIVTPIKLNLRKKRAHTKTFLSHDIVSGYLCGVYINHNKILMCAPFVCHVDGNKPGKIHHHTGQCPLGSKVPHSVQNSCPCINASFIQLWLSPFSTSHGISNAHDVSLLALPSLTTDFYHRPEIDSSPQHSWVLGRTPSYCRWPLV